MMHREARTTVKSISCPALAHKAALSFGFTDAARFFSALRFYFYGFYRASRLA